MHLCSICARRSSQRNPRIVEQNGNNSQTQQPSVEQKHVPPLKSERKTLNLHKGLLLLLLLLLL
jgi:hypothetical protein